MRGDPRGVPILPTGDPDPLVALPARASWLMGDVLADLAVREVETTLAVETVRAVNAITNSNPTGKQTVSTTTATTVRNLQFRQAL